MNSFKKSALFSGVLDALSAEKLVPYLVGSYTNPDGGSLQDIVFKNGLAYISASENGLQVLDISNPESPTKVGSFKLYDGVDVDLAGNLAYNADSSYGLRILDISNSNAPVEIGGYAIKDSGFVFCKSVTLSGSLAYLVMEGIDSDFADNGILIVDVSNPYRPIKINSFGSAFDATGVTISGQYAYVTTEQNRGLLVYDVSNPYNAHQVGSYQVEGFSCVGATINGNYAFALYSISNSRGAPNVLKVLDISDPSSPQLIKSFDALNFLKVVTEGDKTYAFAGDFKADGSGFLQIIEVTDPNNPVWFTGLDSSQGIAIRSDVPISSIDIDGNFAYITESFNGLQIIQFKENSPFLPVLNISAIDAVKPESSAVFLFKIDRTGDLSKESVVDYSTSGDVASNDLINGSGTVFFKIGESSKVVVINVANDDTFEKDESIIVTLSSPSGATLGNAVAKGTIINDDINHTIPTEGDDDLIGTANDDDMQGLGGNDKLSSLAGNDSLNGGFGADTMQGGLGNDTYHVDNARDMVIESSTLKTEIDTVYSEVSYSLSDNVENLVLIDSAVWAVKAIGNSSNNTLQGNHLANVIDGKKGMDTMIGGDGNDTYMVDSSKDIVKEVASDSIAGNDSVKSTASFLLPENVENLYLIGTSAINGTGNALKNTILGNAYNNVINGGLDKDTLTGGLGKDTFVFDTPLKSIDKITDFKPIDDSIRLENAIFTKLKITADHVLDKANFVKSTSAIDGNDFVIYNSKTGALFYDADGNDSGVAVQIATLGVGLNLTHADFLVS